MRIFGTLLLLSLATGCLDPSPESASTEDTDAVESAISGGTVVPNNNAHYGATLKVIHPFSNIERCSAVKIGSQRFLTSAHCVDTWAAGHTMFISNLINPRPDDGNAARWTEVTLAGVYVHPSFAVDPLKDGEFSTSDSYDVAVFDLEETTTSIPTVAIHRGHIGEGTTLTTVGYGRNTQITANAGKKQTATFTQGRGTASDARHAHQLHAVETGTGRQGLDGGDSGGPTYALDGTTLKVAGLNQNGTAKGAPASTDPLDSGFARVANVQRWIDAPHNQTLTTFTGFAFIQTIGLCAHPLSSGSGALVQLIQCEGYDPALHGHLWELLPVAGTSAFQIKSRKYNRCMDLSGTDVVMQPCNSARSAQRWVATPNGDDGMGSFLTNQSDPANGVLGKASGNVPPLTLRVGSSTLGVQRKFLLYR